MRARSRWCEALPSAGGRGAVLLASILAFLALLSGSAQSTRGGALAVRSQQQPLLVQVRLTGTSTRIPPSFLGLGVEVSELESYSRAGGVFGRAVSLLRPGSERSMPYAWAATQPTRRTGIHRRGLRPQESLSSAITGSGNWPAWHAEIGSGCRWR